MRTSLTADFARVLFWAKGADRAITDVYKRRDEDTLGDLNFACKRGETTAIIGSTGSGKSTIAKLILRFHDVTSGSILFNGCDIHGMPQAVLRELSLIHI